MPLTTYTSGEVLTAASLNANFTFAAANPSSGLVPIVPTSVAVGGGAASFSSSTGKITATAATASLSVNGVFSSTYQNYVVQIMLIGAGTAPDFRLRVGGTDSTTSVYSTVQAKAESGTNALSVVIGNENLTNFVSMPRAATTSYMSFTELKFSNPFSSSFQTALMIDQTVMANAQPYVTKFFGAGNYNATTSFDGFTIVTASGSLTGNVQVFGYV